MKKNYEERTFFTVKSLVWAVVVIVVLVVLWGSFYKVNPGYRGVMVTLGKVEKGSLVNGVGLKWPFISDVVNINVQTQAFTAKTSSYTSDV